MRYSHSCTAYRVFHCYYDDRDGKLVGRLKKKQKDDESDDDKPLGKLKKEGAGSKRKAAVCKGFRGVLAGCKCGVRVCVCVRVCADEGGY